MPNTIEEKIWKLGFGYMRLPSKDGATDQELVNRMADKYIESGGNYFDAAFVYEGAEVALRESVIKRHPREKVHIATKLNINHLETPEQMAEQFKISIDRLGADYIDFYLLHGIGPRVGENIDKLGAWDFLADLKAKGLIRHMGFSFHGPAEDLERLLGKYPQAEFCQLQINYYDWHNKDIDSRRLYEIARKYDVPVIVMEPVRGGLLASASSPVAKLLNEANPKVSLASWALRYAAQLEGVLVTLSGMSTMEQLNDNLDTIKDFKPLSEEEMAVIDKAVGILNAVPRVECTACRYCVKECPSEIPIPTLIEIYNDYLIHNNATNLLRTYRLWTRGIGKACDCTGCRACEGSCPQNLEIAETLAKVSALFD